MEQEKFADWPPDRQMAEVRNRFQHREGSGWWTAAGLFVGASEATVIQALIDLETAEIEAIGDCMGGCSMVSPKLEDFVRKP